MRVEDLRSIDFYRRLIGVIGGGGITIGTRPNPNMWYEFRMQVPTESEAFTSGAQSFEVRPFVGHESDTLVSGRLSHLLYSVTNPIVTHVLTTGKVLLNLPKLTYGTTDVQVTNAVGISAGLLTSDHDHTLVSGRGSFSIFAQP